jgi:hypothetical protein
MDIVIDSIGGYCPAQAEGTVNGIPFYFRARGGTWTLSIGEDPVDICCGDKDGYHAWGNDDSYGWMDVDNVKAILNRECKRWLEGGERDEI